MEMEISAVRVTFYLLYFLSWVNSRLRCFILISSALDTANNASYENTSDQERYVFPIPHVNFLFETILNLHPIFFFKGFIAVEIGRAHV